MPLCCQPGYQDMYAESIPVRQGWVVTILRCANNGANAGVYFSDNVTSVLRDTARNIACVLFK